VVWRKRSFGCAAAVSGTVSRLADTRNVLRFQTPGLLWCFPQGDITSVYELIFRRLQHRGLDWGYHFPRLYLVDFRPLREALDQEGKPNWADYSASEALAKEAEDRQRDQGRAEFREQLEEGRKEAIEEALQRPPPAIVQAYRNVYGEWPQGWPRIPGD
jgi:hypothetical protein